MFVFKRAIVLMLCWVVSIGWPCRAMAWTDTVHERMTQDALLYMGSEFADSEQSQAYKFYVEAAGGLENALNILGAAAREVDNFNDTRMGAWWVGYHQQSIRSPWRTLSHHNNTIWWHFLSIGRGQDAHGNDHGGYNFQYRTEDPRLIDNDSIIKAFLFNQRLHSGDYHTTEAHYRGGSASSYHKQYQRFQQIPWQPIDHLARYWYEQFLLQPSLQVMGVVTHAGADVAAVHHTWNTMANYHREYEAWVEDFYYIERLNDREAVQQALADYHPDASIEAILTQTAEAAYCRPDPLYDPSHQARLETAKEMVPLALATNVTLLTKGINAIMSKPE